ncbi:hypothetical protein evm_014796 [Chilo suppressalis]|nr:hypothetical protein evm_014796 [Chilo suppressalis]
MTITVLDNNRDKTTKTFMCSNDSNTLHVQVFDTIYFNLISKLYMNYFWCYNGKGQFTLKGDDYKNMTSAGENWWTLMRIEIWVFYMTLN